MPRRECLRCRVLISQGTYCPTCLPIARGGTTTQRDYGADHQAERAAWTPYVADGLVVCRRCHKPIRPGQSWDLGHPAPKAPEHTACNRGKRRAG